MKYLGFPRDLADYHEGELCVLTNGNIIPLRDGRLFTTMYGTLAGEGRYTNFAVTSSDSGFTWHFHSIVASWNELPEAKEGPDESNTVRLADGRLLCVYRVESGKAYGKSYSSDEGRSWTAPERMEGAWSVEPRLERLDNGVMLLSGGRPGLFLWVCADGEGKRWQPLNLAEHHNACLADPALKYSDAFCEAREPVKPAQSTSYTGMCRIGADEVLICYDRLANGWAGAPGPWGVRDVVFSVRVKAAPKPL